MSAVLACLEWHSEIASHEDCLALPPAALQADADLARAGRDLAAGTGAHAMPDLRKWLQPRDEPPVRLPADRFRLPGPPVPGRHYPRLAFSGLAAGPRDLRPCRLLAREGPDLLLDVNHPLARHAPRLNLSLIADAPAAGRFQHLFEGPGMQVPVAHGPDGYLPAGARARVDEGGDAEFYAEPRLAHHLDAVCRDRLAALHGRFLAPGMAVLDLMSSWVTHLPELPEGVKVTGLGMNAAELAANPRLSQRLVHDLNERPWLPFPDHSFDLALCSASVEYLVQPRAIVAELARVLRPGGSCVISFSDRWFPTKAIRAWSELHPFERLGLVLQLLAEAGFQEPHTFSLRGLKRPEDDKHAALRDYSDPLFAVWGWA